MPRALGRTVWVLAINALAGAVNKTHLAARTQGVLLIRGRIARQCRAAAVAVYEIDRFAGLS